MINIEKGTLIRSGEERDIRFWNVWFLTPAGLHEQRKDAVKWCQENSVPCYTIRPVPVVTDTDGRTEVVIGG